MLRKITNIIICFLFLKTIDAQPCFDSSSYVSCYSKILSLNDVSKNTVAKLTTEEKIAGLSKVWSEAKFGFANFDLVPYLNWDSAYLQFLPRAIEAISVNEYYNVLKNFNQLLRDGHTRIMQPSPLIEKTAFSVPLQIKCVEGKAIITGLLDKNNLPAFINVGGEIKAINNISVEKYIKNKIAPFISFSTPQDSIARIYAYELLSGEKNTCVNLTIQNDKGFIKVINLKRTQDLRQYEPVSFSWLENAIAYIRINSFNSIQVVEQFDSLFQHLTNASALIVDIRNNGGGNSNNGYEILGRLTDTAFATNQTIFKKYNVAQRSWGNIPFEITKEQYWWKPYKKGAFKRPVILLTSSLTYSAAEDFTAAFKCMKRGVIIGQKTGGSSGNPMGYSLPGGGMGFVCSKRELMPDGTEFIGKGISPNIEINETIEDIQKGIDTTLVKAISILNTK